MLEIGPIRLVRASAIIITYFEWMSGKTSFGAALYYLVVHKIFRIAIKKKLFIEHFSTRDYNTKSQESKKLSFQLQRRPCAVTAGPKRQSTHNQKDTSQG